MRGGARIPDMGKLYLGPCRGRIPRQRGGRKVSSPPTDGQPEVDDARRTHGRERVPVADGTADPRSVHEAAVRAGGDDHRVGGRGDLRSLFRSRHDGLLRRRAAERGCPRADPGRPRRAGARMVHGRARGRQHRRGLRAGRRAGADRARDDHGVGERHRGGAGAVERGHAAAQGDVGNARVRRGARRGVHRALESEDPRLSRRARARDGGAVAQVLSRLVRAGCARCARRDAVALPDPHRDRLQPPRHPRRA